MVDPLVSIITPTYNHGKYIGHCVQSALDQHYQNWEMLVVDDGSTDDTWQVIEDYAKRDARVRPFRQENRGIWRLAETYNFALDQAHGTLVAVLEGDDLWSPTKLSSQVPAHVAEDCSLSFGRIRFVDAQGEQISQELYPDLDTFPFFRDQRSDDLVIRLLRGEFFVPAVTALITRHALDAIGGFQQPDYLPVVDYPTWLSLGMRGGIFAFRNEHFADWRQFSGQTTWLLSRQISRGAHRYAVECAEIYGPTLGITVDDTLADRLMSENRRRFFADSSYRAAIVAADRGEFRRGIGYVAEVAKFGQYRKFGTCLAVIASKIGRNSIHRAYAQVPFRKQGQPN